VDVGGRKHCLRRIGVPEPAETSPRHSSESLHIDVRSNFEILLSTSGEQPETDDADEKEGYLQVRTALQHTIVEIFICRDRMIGRCSCRWLGQEEVRPPGPQSQSGHEKSASAEMFQRYTQLLFGKVIGFFSIVEHMTYHRMTSSGLRATI
jgi:hypothetical protein